MEALGLLLALCPPPVPGGQSVELADLARFPPRAVVCNVTEFDCACVDSLERQRNVRRHLWAEYTYVIEAVREAARPWELLERAHWSGAPDDERLEHLRRLRALIGEDAWQRGILPCPVPIWCFAEIHNPLE